MLSLRTGRYFCYKKDQIPRIFYGVRYSAFLMTGFVKNLQRSLYFMCKGAIIALLSRNTDIKFKIIKRYLRKSVRGKENEDCDYR